MKFASTNQKHYPDLGSHAALVWNFCACFSDVISRGNRWWRRKMSSVFSVVAGNSRPGKRNLQAKSVINYYFSSRSLLVQ